MTIAGTPAMNQRHRICLRACRFGCSGRFRIAATMLTCVTRSEARTDVAKVTTTPSPYPIATEFQVTCASTIEK